MSWAAQCEIRLELTLSRNWLIETSTIRYCSLDIQFEWLEMGELRLMIWMNGSMWCPYSLPEVYTVHRINTVNAALLG